MNVVSVVVLIVGLFPQDQEEVDKSHRGDRGELSTVVDGVSRGRTKGPTNRHAQ